MGDTEPSKGSDDVREGIGCILVVIAVFLIFLLLGTVDHLIDYINHWLEARS